jgi:thiamine-phosphate pyrophosphorylase
VADAQPIARERRELLSRARLYLVCGPRPGDADITELIYAAVEGGVDVVQLRDKDRRDHELLKIARVAANACRKAGVLFIVNDRPDIAAVVDADGVHLGQADMPVHRARRVVGDERLVGLSTHTPEQIDRAAQLDRTARVDYIGVGPVHATPTKPGRPAVGLDLVRYAAEHAKVPFFAIGGIESANVRDVVAAGATRIAVVRAIAGAANPATAARELAAALREEARVGPA